MHPLPSMTNDKIRRRIPYEYVSLVTRIKNKEKKKMLFNSYVRAYFRNNEPELELEDVDVKGMIAILVRRERD